MPAAHEVTNCRSPKVVRDAGRHDLSLVNSPKNKTQSVLLPVGSQSVATEWIFVFLRTRMRPPYHRSGSKKLAEPHRRLQAGAAEIFLGVLNSKLGTSRSLRKKV